MSDKSNGAAVGSTELLGDLEKEITQDELDIYNDELNYANRTDSEQASRSSLHWTHS